MLTVVRNSHGTSGLFEEASNLEKETHFGTKNDEAIIDKILEHGNLQENKVSTEFSRCK